MTPQFHEMVYAAVGIVGATAGALFPGGGGAAPLSSCAREGNARNPNMPAVSMMKTLNGKPIRSPSVRRTFRILQL